MTELHRKSPLIPSSAVAETATQCSSKGSALPNDTQAKRSVTSQLLVLTRLRSPLNTRQLRPRLSLSFIAKRGNAAEQLLRNLVLLSHLLNHIHVSLIKSGEIVERRRKSDQGPQDHAGFICLFLSPVTKHDTSTNTKREKIGQIDNPEGSEGSRCHGNKSPLMSFPRHE